MINVENIAIKNIINFYLPCPLVGEGKVYVATTTDSPSAGALQNILELNGVERILVANNLLSVLHDGKNTENVRILILAWLDDLSGTNLPLTVSSTQDITSMEALADALIRPTLNRDNGDIKLLSFDNGKLQLRFTGHCSGCPHAQNTLQNVVIKTFQKYIPSIKEVCLKEI